MEKRYNIRKAKLEDVTFLANAIMSAEKSGSDRLSLATFFNLSEGKIKKLLIEILEEEIEGCEFSIDSFLVVEEEGLPVSAVAGWIEKFENTLPSKILKSNLIGFTFPQESIEQVRENAVLITDLLIEREASTLQIEYVYTDAAHRGKRLAQHLIGAHIQHAISLYPEMQKVQVQLFANNHAAIKLYQRIGFSVVGRYTASSDHILDYLPYSEKLLMEFNINNYTMENSELKEKLKDILVNVLQHDDFEIRDDLTAADVDGWDSLSHAMIIMEIENTLNVKFSLREINKLSDMASLINLIQSKLTA